LPVKDGRDQNVSPRIPTKFYTGSRLHSNTGSSKRQMSMADSEHSRCVVADDTAGSSTRQMSMADSEHSRCVVTNDTAAAPPRVKVCFSHLVGLIC
jgi:hypothetical protein